MMTKYILSYYILIHLCRVDPQVGPSSFNSLDRFISNIRGVLLVYFTNHILQKHIFNANDIDSEQTTCTAILI